MSDELLPAEAIALTVALAQVQRGESTDPNIAAMCVLALARLAGRHDWTKDVCMALDVECCASGRCEVCSPGFDWGRDG